MNHPTKNKLLTGLVILLLAANAATIAVFWLSKPKQPRGPKGNPAEFLVKELALDNKQQEQLNVLVKAHREGAQQLREKIKEAKEAFFNLLKEPAIADSTKHNAAKAVSSITEQLDIMTWDHFKQVRELCTTEQQKKFDEIIHQVTGIIGQQRPPMGPGSERPPGRPGADNHPPPPGE